MDWAEYFNDMCWQPIKLRIGSDRLEGVIFQTNNNSVELNLVAISKFNKHPGTVKAKTGLHYSWDLKATGRASYSS